MTNLPVDAVLFDMDGTLIDESASYREALRLTAALLLEEPVLADETAAIKRFPGLNNDWDATWALVEQHRGRSPRPPTEAERRTSEFRLLRSVFQTFYLGSDTWSAQSGEEAPFPWSEPLIVRETPLVSRETLERLSPFALGIATSRPRAEARMAIRQHDLGRYFPPESIVAQEDASREKPDPAPLFELVRRLGCTSPVYVGDTVNDALAAKAAGMPFIGVGTAGHELDAIYHVDDVNGIVSLLSLAPFAREVAANG